MELFGGYWECCARDISTNLLLDLGDDTKRQRERQTAYTLKRSCHPITLHNKLRGRALYRRSPHKRLFHRQSVTTTLFHWRFSGAEEN